MCTPVRRTAQTWVAVLALVMVAGCASSRHTYDCNPEQNPECLRSDYNFCDQYPEHPRCLEQHQDEFTPDTSRDATPAEHDQSEPCNTPPCNSAQPKSVERRVSRDDPYNNDKVYLIVQVFPWEKHPHTMEVQLLWQIRLGHQVPDDATVIVEGYIPNLPTVEPRDIRSKLTPEQKQQLTKQHFEGESLDSRRNNEVCARPFKQKMIRVKDFRLHPSGVRYFDYAWAPEIPYKGIARFGVRARLNLDAATTWRVDKVREVSAEWPNQFYLADERCIDETNCIFMPAAQQFLLADQSFRMVTYGCSPTPLCGTLVSESSNRQIEVRFQPPQHPNGCGQHIFEHSGLPAGAWRFVPPKDNPSFDSRDVVFRVLPWH